MNNGRLAAAALWTTTRLRTAKKKINSSGSSSIARTSNNNIISSGSRSTTSSNTITGGTGKTSSSSRTSTTRTLTTTRRVIIAAATPAAATTTTERRTSLSCSCCYSSSCASSTTSNCLTSSCSSWPRRRMDDTSTNNAAVMVATATTTRTTIAGGSTSYTPAPAPPLPLPPPENGYVVSLDNNGSRMILHMPIISSSSSNTTNTSSSDMIVATTEDKTSTTTRRKNETMLPPPDTVVQYERQLRKIQAASRASTPLCKTQLHILHNDESLVVVNKPSGVLTVPGIHSNPSILTMLYDMFQHEMESAMKREHMIVHRLDMDTSGIVVFAKTKEAMSKLQSYFRDKKVSKYYEALLCGHVHDNIQEGIINLPLQKDHRFPPFMRVATPESERAAKQVVEDLNHAGWKKIIKKNPKPSETIFQVIGREYVTSKKDQQNAGQQYPVTRVRLIPVTGRTHQLRVHCAAMGHPILGDPTYGIFGEASPNGGFEDDVMDRLLASTSRATVDLQLSLDKYVKEQGLAMCLHARELRIAHPRSGEALTFVQPPNF